MLTNTQDTGSIPDDAIAMNSGLSIRGTLNRLDAGGGLVDELEGLAHHLHKLSESLTAARGRVVDVRDDVDRLRKVARDLRDGFATDAFKDARDIRQHIQKLRDELDVRRGTGDRSSKRGHLRFEVLDSRGRVVVAVVVDPPRDGEVTVQVDEYAIRIAEHGSPSMGAPRVAPRVPSGEPSVGDAAGASPIHAPATSPEGVA